jgi:hypothetical protein
MKFASEHTAAILLALAEGRSIEQILRSNPRISTRHVKLAASEGLAAIMLLQRGKPASPAAGSGDSDGDGGNRAGRAWSPQEEDRLVALFEQDRTFMEIGRALGRSSNTVRRRLVQLGLVDREGNRYLEREATSASSVSAR